MPANNKTKYKVVPRNYSFTPDAQSSTPQPEPETAKRAIANYGWYALIACIFCGVIGLTTGGIFGGILILFSVLLGLFFIYLLFQKEIQEFFEDNF